MNKPRVFLDASVLFAAAYSSHGKARDLIRLAIQSRVDVVMSQDVLDEVERNLSNKVPELVESYQRLLRLLSPEIVALPSKEEVWAAEAYVAQKDAAIVAAAIKAKPDYLVTYDRKHLLSPAEVAEQSSLVIVTPDVIVDSLENPDDL